MNHENDIELNVKIHPEEVLVSNKSLSAEDLPKVAEAIRSGAVSSIVLKRISDQLKRQGETFEALDLTQDEVDGAGEKFHTRETTAKKERVLSGDANPWTIESSREDLLAAGLTPEQLTEGKTMYLRTLAESEARRVLQGQVQLKDVGEEIVRYLNQIGKTLDDVGLTKDGIQKGKNLYEFTSERDTILRRNASPNFVRSMNAKLHEKNLTLKDIDLTSEQVWDSRERYDAQQRGLAAEQEAEKREQKKNPGRRGFTRFLKPGK